MKRTTSTLTACFCAAAAVAGGIAATGMAAAQDTAAAGSASLEKLLGSGTCSGKTLSHDMKSYHPTTGRFTSEKTLDGHWVVIHYDEDQSAVVQKPYHVVQYVGYDAPMKRLVTVNMDNSGSSFSTGTSQGWKGDTITFDESVNGKPAVFRDTFTQNGAHLSSHVGTMRDKSGRWIKTDEENCKAP